MQDLDNVGAEDFPEPRTPWVVALMDFAALAAGSMVVLGIVFAIAILILSIDRAAPQAESRTSPGPKSEPAVPAPHITEAK
jgi:hypothetical protein